MDQFIPDIYQKSIYAIDYQALKQSGIRCLLFDLNNTMVPIQVDTPTKELKDLFAYLEGMKFKLILLSNAKKVRVAPFKEKLNVDAAFRCGKPRKKKFQRILNLYHFQVHEVACIGDHLITDIYGANRMGFTSILVNPISERETFWVEFSRVFERILYRHFSKKKILERGVYYE